MSPEIKAFIRTLDTTDYNEYTIKNYVEVIQYYSRGSNLPDYCGYISQVRNNVINVKYAPACDSGRLHNNIPIRLKAIPATRH